MTQVQIPATPFSEERRAFRRLRQTVDNDAQLRGELEAAITDLLTAYNTKIPENRFVVGGALEILVATALRASGLDARTVGAQLKGADIFLPEGGLLSIKSSFSEKPSGFNLLNFRGAGGGEWRHATVFAIANHGFVYADPDLMRDSAKYSTDALTLRWPLLRDHMERHPEFVCKLSIPPTGKIDLDADVKSKEALLGTITTRGLTMLLKHLPPEARPRT